MLMKWSDLEAGDILRFTEKVCERYKESGRDWYAASYNVNLIVKSVEIVEMEYSRIIRISFSNYSYYDSLVIKEDGTASWVGCPLPLFDIVSLKDE